MEEERIFSIMWCEVVMNNWLGFFSQHKIMSRATNIIAGNSKITLTTLHADWCTRIMGFDVIGHHGETEQRHGCICKRLGQSHMYPFRYTYMMAMVTRLENYLKFANKKYVGGLIVWCGMIVVKNHDSCWITQFCKKYVKLHLFILPTKKIRKLKIFFIDSKWSNSDDYHFDRKFNNLCYEWVDNSIIIPRRSHLW